MPILGALTLQALVALVIFAVGALAVTSLSVRQLVATRYAARSLARDQLVKATVSRLESAPYELPAGRTALDPVVVDGLTFRRDLEVAEEEVGKLLLLTVTIWIENDKAERVSPVWSYEKRVLKL